MEATVVAPHREVQVVISLSGILKFRLEKHAIEDHLLYLKILEGAVSDEVLGRIKRAEEVVSKEDVRLLDEEREESLKETFRHILCLLRSIDF